MQEEWKFLPWTLKYSISNMGRVRNDETREIIIPQEIRGQPWVNLSILGIRSKHFIGKLVAGAFIPNPDNLPNVCRKDTKTKDYSVSNLYWGRRGRPPGIKSEATYAHPGNKKVQDLETGAIYESAAAAARAIGASSGNVRMCARGERARVRGRSFKYVN